VRRRRGAVLTPARRRALQASVLCLFAACDGAPPDTNPANAAPPAAATASPARTLALTIDDLPTISTSRDIARQREITDGILAALQAADAPAIGFVNEGKLYENGALDSARVALLRQWLDAGRQLGNHTYSHPDLHATPLAEFQRDVLAGERVTRALLAERNAEPRWFRHPFLHTGTSLETKRGLESFLAEHGYRVAPVTIDNYDYVFARAYDRALDAADSTAADSVARTYIAYMDTVTGFYEAQARAIVGHEPPQVLLLHANRLNAHHLDDLLAMLQGRGYGFVTIDEALEDSAYALPDEYVGPAGITWLHRWALTKGLRGIFAGEPEVPAWITARAESR
jgi:peptidoglycan/xylan/chitin deacetylase (PgdA/CDA1 family)